MSKEPSPIADLEYQLSWLKDQLESSKRSFISWESSVREAEEKIVTLTKRIPVYEKALQLLKEAM